jgi:hypothetical protein
MEQEKKNKIQALLLALLLLCITAFVFLDKDDRNFEVDKNTYNDYDLKSVDRVILEAPNQKTDLRYQGYRWMVNDSIEADRSLVEVLFATIKQAEPQRPVATTLRDSVIKTIHSNGVKISVYAGESNLKVFYAGGNAAKTQSIFMADGSAEPHHVTIPGYRVYVSGIFEVPPHAWREKLIFNFKWENFVKLETRYRNSQGNFDVVLEKDQVLIPQVVNADTAKLNSYLDNVSLLTVDEYIVRGKLTDSLSNATPVAQITAIDIANRKYSLSVFSVGRQFYGLINGKYWAILSENKIIPLLRPKDFFAKK